MNIGIIGPPLSGKTTTFHLLTGTKPNPSSAFKREMQTGVTFVPDFRVDKLAEISNSKKITHTTVEYVDTPGIEPGAAKTDWFAAALSGGVKNSDGLLLVVRAFGEGEMSAGSNPERDVLAVQEELNFADLVVLENRLERMRKQRRVKAATHEETVEMELLERGKGFLESGRPLRLMPLEPHERKALRGFQFLSAKPMLAVVNASDDKLHDVEKSLGTLNDRLAGLQVHAIALSAALEGEIARLEGEEQAAFMSDLGVTELARDRVLKASYELLGLITFLTTGEKESRAWPLRRGETAVDAAAEIHTDLAKGFIRAEVVHYDDLVREGGYPGCKAKGLLRLEGKEYIVKDGDVLVIRHSS
jgi:hypothetical protein